MCITYITVPQAIYTHDLYNSPTDCELLRLTNISVRELKNLKYPETHNMNKHF